MTYFATIAGHPVQAATLHIPSAGPWVLDADLVDGPALAGAVDVVLGARTLRGTVDPRYTAGYALRRSLRVVAGAGAWGDVVAPKDYHNDAGIRPRILADDVAREVGETIGDFAPTESVGVHYVRAGAAAARVLDDVAGDVPWWVDLDGVTQVRARATVDAPASAYEVLDYDTRARLLRLAVDDVAAIVPGVRIAARLDAVETVREAVVDVTAEGLRVTAWCGGARTSRSRAADALRATILAVLGPAIYGPRRYRVIAMSGDRVQLQAVSRAAGLPDILPISQSPGVAGAHAQLAEGSLVLVEFVDGDPAQPLVTHFAGRDGVGWVPVSLVIDATTSITLGAGATSKVSLADLVDARIAAVRTAFNAHTHTETGGTTTPPIVPLAPQAATAAAKVSAE